jgi:methionyl-tRNA synthetase
VHRFNADLANDYGNLLNRTLPQVQRHFDGRVPAPGPARGGDALLRQTASDVARSLEPLIDRLDFSRALSEIWRLLGVANKYLDEEAPWTAVKTDRERAGTVLYNTLEAVRIATILLSPWLPTATAKVWEQLGITTPLGDQRLTDAEAWAGLVPGTVVRPGVPVFPRIERVRVRSGEKSTTEGSSVAEAISIDAFRRLDIRVGEVLEATRVPGTDKLIEVKVDVGEVRTIITGLIPHYQPEELVGRRIIVLTNLEPRRVRGVDSNGMLLAAEWGGEIGLLTVDKDAPRGAKIT